MKLKIRLQTTSETFDQFEADWKDLEKGAKPSRLAASSEPVLYDELRNFSEGVFNRESSNNPHDSRKTTSVD